MCLNRRGQFGQGKRFGHKYRIRDQCPIFAKGVFCISRNEHDLRVGSILNCLFDPCRAIHTRRGILLADEPVSSVDEHQGLNLLQQALARHDSAVIALHDRQQALQACTRIIGLRDGAIVLDAPCATLSLADLDPLYQ